MATHHGKEGVVKTGSNVTGEVTAFTLETTGDVVEDTSLSDSAKTFLAGRTSFSGSVECHFDETDTSQEEMTVGSSLTFTLLSKSKVMCPPNLELSIESCNRFGFWQNFS